MQPFAKRTVLGLLDVSQLPTHSHPIDRVYSGGGVDGLVWRRCLPSFLLGLFSLSPLSQSVRPLVRPTLNLLRISPTR